jgi:hypothetical protein
MEPIEGGISGVDGWIRKNKKAIQQVHDEDFALRKMAYRFGLTLKQALQYNQQTTGYFSAFPKEQAKALTKRLGKATLTTQFALKKCNKRGKPIDKDGKVVR